MEKFNINKELQKKSKNKSFEKFNSQRFLLSILVLTVCLTIGLGITYSANVVSSSNVHLININIENGYQEKFTTSISGASFSQLIDSNYKKALITCDNGEVEYNEETRKIYGKNITSDINCVIAFDKTTPKVAINYANLKSVNDNYGTSFYFDKNAQDNYFNFNGLLFRIVRINGDGTYRLILNAPIGETFFGNNNFTTSNVKNYLETWFNNNIGNNKNIVIGDFDSNIYSTYGQDFIGSLVNFNSYDLAKVGLLSINEINIIINDETINEDSYLYGTYYTLNKTEENLSWTVKRGLITSCSSSEYLGIRPVINVKVDELSGTGTVDDPFQLKEE